MYKIYWLISKSRNKTYIGFTSNIKQRLNYHFVGKVKTTENFGNFRCFILEEVVTLLEARCRERYWKSCAGRKKLKIYYKKIEASSSNG